MSDALPAPSQPSPTRHRTPDWTWLAIVAQVALLGLLVAWLGSGLPLGIPLQWAWKVHAKPLPIAGLLRSLLIGAEILGLCWLGLWRLRHRRSVAWIVAGVAFLTFALQVSVAWMAPRAGFDLVAATGNRVSTEYFSVARDVRDPWAYCRDFAATQPAGHHVATHPPGAVLAYWACLQVYRSPVFPRRAFDALAEQVIGAPRDAIATAAASYPFSALAPDDVGAALFCCLVFGACAALAVVPLYWLASRAASRSAALVACCIFALAPAPVLFFQGLDAPILLLATGALALAYAAVTRRRLAAGALCGAALGLLCAITFGATAAVATVAVLAAVLLRRLPPEQRRRAWACVGLGAAVWLAALLALHLLCDGKLHVIFAQAMHAHREVTFEGYQRRYSIWVGLNLVEFACFLGFPTVVAVAAALGSVLRRGVRALPVAEVIGLVGLAVLVALDLSGSVRGEVGRVWMFLMPPLILWAGCWFRRALRRRALVATAVAVAVVQLVFLGWMLTPVVLPY